MRNPLPFLRPGWIPIGWFVAACLTALAILALVSFGVLSYGPAADNRWVAMAMVFGFLVAGFVTGTQVAGAPVLHGLGIGLFSLLVWVVVNLFLGEPTDQTAWATLSARSAFTLVILQTAAAVVGTRLGVRWVRRP